MLQINLVNNFHLTTNDTMVAYTRINCPSYLAIFMKFYYSTWPRRTWLVDEIGWQAPLHVYPYLQKR